MKKIFNKKSLGILMSATLAVSSTAPSVFAVDDATTVIADNSYENTAHVDSNGSWDEYDINLTFDVNNGTFTNIRATSDNMQSYNNVYLTTALDKFKSLEGKSATISNVEQVDATSGATYSLSAMKTAMKSAMTEAPASSTTPTTPDSNTSDTNSNTETSSETNTIGSETQDTNAENTTLYGKVNLSYADFYYGELNNITENSNVINLETTDKSKNLKAKGMYDAVSSATPNKFKSMFPSTYYSENENGGGKILGVKDVSIAINKKLYDDAMKAIADGRSSNNPLLDIVKNITLNDKDAPAPVEYKTINGDGSLSKTHSATDAVVDNEATATISTTNRYGHYGLNITSTMLPKIAEIEGVIITTTDGKSYAMKHLENIWVRPNEISFAAKANFVEPHGNLVNYMAYEDMQGKTIASIKYLIKDKADLIINTNLFCKHLLDNNNTITVENKVFENGVSITPVLQTPENTNYQIASVTKGRKELVKDTDYTVNGNNIIFMETENTGIGAYSVKFVDDNFADMVGTFTLTSNHPEGSVKIENNKLILPNDLSPETYYNSITKVMIDGKTVKGRNIINSIFGDTLTADFNASISRHGEKMPIFAKDKEEYQVEFVSAGYPSVTGILSNKSDKSTISGNDENTANVDNQKDSNMDNSIDNTNNESSHEMKNNTPTKEHGKGSISPVNTGDYTNVFLYLSILISSLCGISILGFRKKDK